eukprot:gene10490-21883_t
MNYSLSVCTHPIWLLARTDAELTKLYHSFYIATTTSVNDIKILQRVPQNKPGVDDIESGLKLFLKEAIDVGGGSLEWGSFAVATSLGIRYFLSWRLIGTRYFVAASSMPTISFSRELFALLETELPSNVPTILHMLCEIPILPSCGIRYKIKFSKGSAILDFTSSEQTNERDVAMVALTLLNANMMVAGWEAILLERKVLIKSSSTAVISAICEFFRRIVLPLPFVNVFIPLLPEVLLSTIEAPFPYLVGAESETLRNAQVDLSDTVIIDVDGCCVIDPRGNTTSTTSNTNSYSSSSLGSSAPLFIKQSLISNINDILIGPLDAWMKRPCNNNNNNNGHDHSYDHNQGYSYGQGYPLSPEDLSKRNTEIHECFIRTTISLMCARHCSMKAFFRHPYGLALTSPLSKRNSSSNQSPDFKTAPFRSDDSASDLSTGFTKKAGGGMLFVPCWIEMDAVMFAVYEFADELPHIYLSVKEIAS